MTVNNPYAPPTAIVEDVTPLQSAPPLWNPNAAARWSLLFSPIFGAVLHMKNWDAMGEPAKAAESKKWVFASVAFFVVFLLVSVVLPESKAIDGLGRLTAFALLISWYYTSGKPQDAFVLARYGKSYTRRGWAKPLSLAVLAFAGLFVLAVLADFVVGFFTGAT